MFYIKKFTITSKVLATWLYCTLKIFYLSLLSLKGIHVFLKVSIKRFSRKKLILQLGFVCATYSFITQNWFGGVTLSYKKKNSFKETEIVIKNLRTQAFNISDAATLTVYD